MGIVHKRSCYTTLLLVMDSYPFNFQEIPLSEYENDPELKDVYKKFRKITHGFERVGPHRFVAVKGAKDVVKRIYNMKVTEKDIWVVTYPRSGTTWTQEMVWNITNGLDFEKARKTDIDEKFFFLDMDWLQSGSHGNAPGFIDKAEKAVGQQRMIKSHLPLGLLPPSLLETSNVIYVARNPKDVVVSYYHHHKLTKSMESDMKFSAFVKFFMKEMLVDDPYMAHVMEAVNLRNNPNIKFLWYEDMKKDLQSTIRDVAEFLDKDLSDQEIAILADYLDLKNMKKTPAVNHQDRHDRGAFAEGECFIRKGVAGGWREYFDDDLDKKFNEWIQEKTKNIPIDFKWE